VSLRDGDTAAHHATIPRSGESRITIMDVTEGGVLRLALSRRDAAAALGMSLSHFQRHVQPYVRCVYSGQLRLYPVKELERWLEVESCEGGRAA
jgi:hypothetical protein